MTDLIDRIPAPIRSLWNAETELRRGLWASILRRGQPNPHYKEARRHFDEAMATRQRADPGKWGSRDHVEATVKQDKVDAVDDYKTDTSNAPRF